MIGQPNKLDFRTDSFRPYATAIGEMALAWNDLHETLKDLFWSSLGVENGVIAYAVWYSSKSDRAQRDMLRGLATTPAIGNRLNNTTKPEVLWAIQRADSLEDLRNDILHSPFFASERGDVEPLWQAGHQRAKKLAGKDLLREMNWFYGATLIVRDYAWEISQAVRHERNSLPERPGLPNRGDTNDKKLHPLE